MQHAIPTMTVQVSEKKTSKFIDNRDAFAANPERYAPQYGGYCAWAVSQGYTASGDPTVWAIVDDKLYINYNKKIGERWSVDPKGFIVLADGNWPKVLSD